MRSPHPLLSTSLALLTTLSAAQALATPGFPAAIQSELSLSYAPDCSVCHDGSPSSSTVTQPFGVAMRGSGLVKYNDGSVATALQALETAGQDSDCDGTSDIAALEGGWNPNTGAVIDGSDKAALASPGCADALETPAYGCGAQIVSGPVSAEGSAAALAALLGLSLVRRRPSRRTRPSETR